MLVGKLAGGFPVDSTVKSTMRKVAAHDPDERVRRAAQQGLAGIRKGRAELSMEERLITPHGGYEALESYKMAEIAFDGTVFFCNRYVSRKSRTHDQMWQSARSGKQNIAEGSQVSGTSKKSELKLVGVARGSLEELIKDYHDFLRIRKLPCWDKNDPRALEVRRIAYDDNKTYESYKSYFEDKSPEIAANALLCVIHQSCYLLDRQLDALEQAFVEEGGFTERLYRVRTASRHRQQNKR
jgi:four helix bundle suffix protein